MTSKQKSKTTFKSSLKSYEYILIQNIWHISEYFFQSSGGECVDSVELLDSGVLGLGRIGSGGGF